MPYKPLRTYRVLSIAGWSLYVENEGRWNFQKRPQEGDSCPIRGICMMTRRLTAGRGVPHTESICALPAGNGPPAELESKSSES
jgi:hypothetical protein